MANLDRAYGLEPVEMNLGAHLYGIVTSNSGAIYLQSLVEHNGTAYATKKGSGIPGCAIEETGAAGSLLGSVLACFDHNLDPLLYIPDATTGDGIVAGYVLVTDHILQRYTAQEDSGGNSITKTEIGWNADMAGTGGSTITGISTMEIDSDTAANTATLAVKLLEVHPADTAESSNCRFIVMINAHHNAANVVGV